MGPLSPIDVLSLLAALVLLPHSLFVLFVTLAAMAKHFGFYKTSGPNQPLSAIDHASPGLIVIIPAHNEESVISHTVRSAFSAAAIPTSKLEVIVIADNCTDQTGMKARACGARVIERNSALRGKGHALAEVLKTLADDHTRLGHDLWVIFDADSTIDPGYFNAMFSDVRHRGLSFFQGYYSVSNSEENWRTRLMTLAFSLFNGTWLQGCDQLGLGAGIRGNGFGGTVKALRTTPWKSSGLAEDLEFSWHLRVLGVHVGFIKGAVVRAEIPTLSRNAKSQRQRWETGRRDVRRMFLPKILGASSIGLVKRTLLLLDLTMPPIGRLGAAVIFENILFFFVGSFIGISEPVSIAKFCAAASLGSLMLYLLSAFVVMSLPWRYLTAVVHLPAFLAWKALTAMGKRPTAWVRTEREKTDD